MREKQQKYDYVPVFVFEGAEKSKKREAAEAGAILQLHGKHNCKIAELPLNAAEQENDMQKQEPSGSFPLQQQERKLISVAAAGA